MHRFEQRKRHVAVVLSALGKNKHQAVWVEALPLLFCVRCSSLIGLTLAERFNAQIRAEKTPCGSRAVCVGKK